MIILGIIIFREKITHIELIGISLIMFGGALISFKKNKFKINKYIWSIMGASLFFALAMMIDVRISEQFNLAFYFFMLYLIPAVLIIIGKKITFTELKEEFFKTGNSPKFFLIAGTTSSLGMLFYLLALRQGQVSIVAPLSSITVLLNVLAGYIFLKEKKDPLKRIFAAALVIGGVFLLV
jgi:drug/metabolite transporter (DMT)-like permease